MKKLILSMFFVLFFVIGINAQNIVKGIIIDSDSENPLQGVKVSVLNTISSQVTGIDGVFIIKDLPNGSYVLEVKITGYESQNFPVEFSGKAIDLGTILLYKNFSVDQDLSLITITDDELNDDAIAADNIAGLLQATQDIFLRTAAFEFSSSFFRIKGLDSGNGKVLINDEASPMMELKSDRSKIYWQKIDNMASVIAQIGAEKANTSPAIIGVAEIENLSVLEDLVKSPHLIKKDYGIIHYDSPDKRGIDVALLYQKRYFKPIYHEAFNPNIYRENYKVYTRDQLLVSGYLDDELIHVIVNHWPSRSGGEAKSRSSREKAAYQNTKIIEKIRENDADAKILIMGDFNDDPTNSSFKNVLKTQGKKEDVAKNDIFNPYEDLHRRGFNTLGYRDNINLFDMVLISEPLLDKGEKDFSSYKMFRAMIFNKRFLTGRTGKYKGYPFRSFSDGGFTGGYSDHYPVYIYLIKEKK